MSTPPSSFSVDTVLCRMSHIPVQDCRVPWEDTLSRYPDPVKYIIFQLFHRSLLHNLVLLAMFQHLCSSFRLQILKTKIVSPDDLAYPTCLCQSLLQEGICQTLRVRTAPPWKEALLQKSGHRYFWGCNPVHSHSGHPTRGCISRLLDQERSTERGPLSVVHL